MRRSLILLLSAVLMSCASVDTKPLIGDWNGTLKTPAGDLRVVFHFTESETGYTCAIDSLDQGASNIPCGEVAVNDNLVNINVPAIGGKYAGTLDGNTLQGEWTQGGFTLDLDLIRAAE